MWRLNVNNAVLIREAAIRLAWPEKKLAILQYRNRGNRLA
jgi:hypothetical protein